ncbi:MAG: DUF2703 domain-containing protein [Nitrospira sp.]|nr:DUF2703 domain-containing protein [bacterium]MBL7048647.1 DUF2703 domain-containing protein [Nitrospira sp.]
MDGLKIRWRRLISESGRTCARCSNTGESVEAAFKKLQKALSELSVKVSLEKEDIDYESFKSDPLQSNQVWINGKLLEEWIGGTIGQSQCCDVCGDSDCRTILIGRNTFEAVPEKLIIRAGLLAASDLYKK